MRAETNVWNSDKVYIGILQHCLLSGDVLLNIFADSNLTSQLWRLSLFLVQDVAQILLFIILLLLIVQKPIIRRRLFAEAVKHFAPAIILCLVYLMLTVGWQTMGWQPDHWNSSCRTIVLVLQRLLSAVNYTLYKVSSDQLLNGHFVQMCMQVKQQQ